MVFMFLSKHVFLLLWKIVQKHVWSKTQVNYQDFWTWWLVVFLILEAFLALHWGSALKMQVIYQDFLSYMIFIPSFSFQAKNHVWPRIQVNYLDCWASISTLLLIFYDFIALWWCLGVKMIVIYLDFRPYIKFAFAFKMTSLRCLRESLEAEKAGNLPGFSLHKGYAIRQHLCDGFYKIVLFQVRLPKAFRESLGWKSR